MKEGNFIENKIKCTFNNSTTTHIQQFNNTTILRITMVILLSNNTNRNNKINPLHKTKCHINKTINNNILINKIIGNRIMASTIRTRINKLTMMTENNRIMTININNLNKKRMKSNQEMTQCKIDSQ